MKRKKVYFNQLLAVILCLGFMLMPIPVFASNSLDSEIDLTNYSDTNTSGPGYTWDAKAKKLTLTNLTIHGKKNIDAAVKLPNGKVTVDLVGDNVFDKCYSAFTQDPPPGQDILLTDSVTLTGSGSLTIKDALYMCQGSLNTLIVDGTRLYGSGQQGFVINSSFIAKNGAYVEIKLTNENVDDPFNPIYAGSSIECYDSRIIAYSNKAGGGGLYVTGIGTNTSAPVMKFVNSDITTYGNSAGYSGYIKGTGMSQDNGKLYIENSIIRNDRLIYASQAELVGNVQFITPKNIEILRVGTENLILNLTDSANLQGYIFKNSSKDMIYATDYTLESNLQVSDGRNLKIMPNAELTLASGVKVTKNGSAKIINDGIVHVMCNEPDAIKVDQGNQPKLVHKFVNYVSDNYVSCTENGTETAICEYGDKAIDVREILALGHRMVKIEKKTATCTETGREEYWKCEICDNLFSNEYGEIQIDQPTIIPAFGHQYETGAWKSDQKNHWQECTICAEKSNITPHTYKWVVDRKTTTTEKGLKHKKCEICGYIQEDNNTPKTSDSHNLNQWMILSGFSFVGLLSVGLYDYKKKIK